MNLISDDTYKNILEKKILELMTNDVVNFEIDNLKIEVQPSVFPPQFFYESKWYAEKISNIVGKKSLLEIGTGTGIISLVAANKGANVTATDVDEFVIENAKKNFLKNNLTANFYVGDVYSPLPGSAEFDYIFWNHPFNYSTKQYEKRLFNTVFDYKYKSTKKYISEGYKYLKNDGELLLGTSNIADLNKIMKIVEDNNMVPVLLAETSEKSEIEDHKQIKYFIYKLVKPSKIL